MINIRFANESDIDPIKTIAADNVDEVGFVFPALIEASKRQELLVAVDNGNVVGFANYHHRKKDVQTTLYEICVASSCRRQGIGRLLMERLVEESIRAGKSKIVLKCPHDLPANEFYRKLGFANKGQQVRGKKRPLNLWERYLKKEEGNMNGNKEKAIVLASGGMDSTVMIAIAKQNYEVYLLHIDYGQRTEAREHRAVDEIADYYGIDDEHRKFIELPFLKAIGGSSLTDEKIDVPDAKLDSHEIPSTYVPFRNGIFITLAVSWAEVIGATKIFIGAVEVDGSGYPDCRQEFYKSFNHLIEVGTKPETHITIETPLIKMHKSDIVREGNELGAPLHLSWSCYQNSEVACGKCDSCVLRLRGFQQAGVEDKIPYANK